jgi:hypothetical protein
VPTGFLGGCEHEISGLRDLLVRSTLLGLPTTAEDLDDGLLC